ncbi:hypothetical protein Y788_03425 [Pantoea dispersa 625]|nr:hypothetical protein Y788_03425 [Pantoea dispersa 625]
MAGFSPPGQRVMLAFSAIDAGLLHNPGKVAGI